MRAQRATLIQVGSCRVTNALLLLLAQALHFLLQEALALLLLGVLGAPPRVQLKTPHFAASYQPAASARSQQPRSSPCRWTPCPGPPDPDAASPQRPAGPAARHYVQYEQTGGTEVGRQGCRREKCQEALCSRLLLLSLLVVVPSSRWTCPEWCARWCGSKSFMIKFIFKSAASLRSMTPRLDLSPIWTASRRAARCRRDSRHSESPEAATGVALASKDRHPGCNTHTQASEPVPPASLRAPTRPPAGAARLRCRSHPPKAAARLALTPKVRRHSAQSQRNNGWARADHGRARRREHAHGRGAAIVGTKVALLAVSGRSS